MMSSTPSSYRRDEDGESIDSNPPTIAAFSPATLSHATSANKQRSTILVHQKSPLLIATPPQITRALAYSHPFLLPLNKFAGLLTWTTDDPWESFLLVAAFWGVVLYGDVVMRFAGPVVVVMGLILGMYSRRYSPLSSTGWTGEKQPQKKGHKKVDSEVMNTKHQKTLDEIVETLKIFTSRCNILLDPLLELTDFLSTQRTATSATTRPALTTLLIRILLVTPLWMVLTLRPIQIITTKRIVLFTGTVFLTWHSRPNRVARAILWRSALVRRICSAVTGLHLTDTLTPPGKSTSKSALEPDKPNLPPRKPSTLSANSIAPSVKHRPTSPGVRFTFILYENQRRWVGLGWTTSLFAYERAAWTDEHNNPAPAREDFELPDVEDGLARWRWVEESQWLVEGAKETEEGGSKAKEGGGSAGGMGWIYYDNKWQNGRRGQDGWGRYTRRRKWYRDAELVEVSASTEITPSPTPSLSPNITPNRPSASSALTNNNPASKLASDTASDAVSIRSKTSSMEEKLIDTGGKGFRPGNVRRRGTAGTTASRRSSMSVHSTARTGSDDDDAVPRGGPRGGEWGIGDDARMGLE